MATKWEVNARIIVEASTAEAAEQTVQELLDEQTDHGPLYDSFIDGPAQRAKE